MLRSWNKIDQVQRALRCYSWLHVVRRARAHHTRRVSHEQRCQDCMGSWRHFDYRALWEWWRLAIRFQIQTSHAYLLRYFQPSSRSSSFTITWCSALLDWQHSCKYTYAQIWYRNELTCCLRQTGDVLPIVQAAIKKAKDVNLVAGGEYAIAISGMLDFLFEDSLGSNTCHIRNRRRFFTRD